MLSARSSATVRQAVLKLLSKAPQRPTKTKPPEARGLRLTANRWERCLRMPLHGQDQIMHAMLQVLLR
eukprot:1343368-Amphidinium_carterae.1